MTLTRPVVLAGIEPAPPLPLSSQTKGQTGFKTSEYFYLWSARVTSRYITWVPALRLARVIAIYTPCSPRQYQHRPMKFFKQQTETEQVFYFQRPLVASNNYGGLTTSRAAQHHYAD